MAINLEDYELHMSGGCKRCHLIGDEMDCIADDERLRPACVVLAIQKGILPEEYDNDPESRRRLRQLCVLRKEAPALLVIGTSDNKMSLDMRDYEVCKAPERSNACDFCSLGPHESSTSCAGPVGTPYAGMSACEVMAMRAGVLPEVQSAWPASVVNRIYVKRRKDITPADEIASSWPRYDSIRWVREEAIPSTVKDDGGCSLVRAELPNLQLVVSGTEVAKVDISLGDYELWATPDGDEMSCERCALACDGRVRCCSVLEPAEYADESPCSLVPRLLGLMLDCNGAALLRRLFFKRRGDSAASDVAAASQSSLEDSKDVTFWRDRRVEVASAALCSFITSRPAKCKDLPGYFAEVVQTSVRLADDLISELKKKEE